MAGHHIEESMTGWNELIRKHDWSGWYKRQTIVTVAGAPHVHPQTSPV